MALQLTSVTGHAARQSCIGDTAAAAAATKSARIEAFIVQRSTKMWVIDRPECCEMDWRQKDTTRGDKM
jgi:hypothetical protein